MRVPVNPGTLDPAGPTEFVAAIDNADDFCIDEDAGFAYVTRHRGNTRHDRRRHHRSARRHRAQRRTAARQIHRTRAASCQDGRGVSSAHAARLA
jgi:hypothetical protein